MSRDPMGAPWHADGKGPEGAGEVTGMDRPAPSLEFQLFRRRLHERCGFDLGAYKTEQMERRTRQWMGRRGIATMAALMRLLERDERARADFLDYLTINTSQFFRDPATWEALRSRVLPELLAAFGRLRIWSAGCSIGAEPYTLAILLHEMGQAGRHRITATDIDEEALARARAGEYHELHLVNVPDALRRRYFSRTPAGSWRIEPSIAAEVRLSRHDLLRDPYPTGQHLILCRHVLIYLTAEAQARLVGGLSRALTVGGVLVVGGPEQIGDPAAYGLERLGHSLYRRLAPPA